MVAEPEAVSVAVVSVAEPEAVSVAVVSAAEPQASVDIAVAFDSLVPVSVVVVEVDSPGHPRFVAFPNVDYYSTSSSSAEVVDDQSVHSATGARTNCDPCSTLSTPGLHQNRNVEHCCNNPSPGHNNVSDTSGLAMDATTSRSRKTGLHLYRELRRHCSYPVTLSLPEALQIRRAAVDQY